VRFRAKTWIFIRWIQGDEYKDNGSHHYLDGIRIDPNTLTIIGDNDDDN